MKLFLTSSGLANRKIVNRFISELKKEIKENKVLVIAYARNNNEQSYVNESKKELEELGFENITIVNLNDEIITGGLGNFDVVYICGGNTYAILKKLKETGLDQFIISQVENDAIYVGVSAGSIIAGNDIEIAGWGSEGDENAVGLDDFGGLRLTDVAIFPHFREDLHQEVEEFRNKADYLVRELTDNQAFFCKDKECELIE